MMLLAPCLAAEEKTSLEDIQAELKEDPQVFIRFAPLKNQWVGDLQRKDGTRDARGVRLERGGVIEGQIFMARVYPNGSYNTSDIFWYRKAIPADEKLRSCQTLEQLNGLLGEFGGSGYAGWGGPEWAHQGAHAWLLFSPLADARMTCVRIFAQVGDEEPGKIKRIFIERGELKPADPGNAQEWEKYLSGADVFDLDELAKEKEREIFPQPLRDLVAVEELPYDAEYKQLSAAVQAVRNDPDPELFYQLAKHLDHGRHGLSGLLGQIMVNEFETLKLQPWGEQQEKKAVMACIDSMQYASKKSRREIALILLKLCGGGAVEVDDGSEWGVVAAKQMKEGYSVSYMTTEQKATLEQTQQALRDLYAKYRKAKQ